jgi:hypothetical protein
VVITGTLPGVCYADGMTRFLQAGGIGIFDYPQFAMTLRDRVRDRAASLAAAAGITIEHIAKAHICKEDVVAKVLAKGGDHACLVHIISAMEACEASKPWHDEQTHKTSVRPDSGNWAPVRLQLYCNGHSWLAGKLSAEGIGYTMADNAFVHIDDWSRAQALADSLHRILDRYATQCCPVSEVFGQTYLSREPDAGGVRHRPGVPIHHHPRPALRAVGLAVGTERQS